MVRIKKRDGTSKDIRVINKKGEITPFESLSIYDDIERSVREIILDEKSYVETAAELSLRVEMYIRHSVADGDIHSLIGTDDIQDWIENCLMDFDKEIAKAYIRRRCRRKIEEKIVYNLGLRG